MSTDGLPTINEINATGLRVAVVTAIWNSEICDLLHARAVNTGHALGQPSPTTASSEHSNYPLLFRNLHPATMPS